MVSSFACVIWRHDKAYMYAANQNHNKVLTDRNEDIQTDTAGTEREIDRKGKKREKERERERKREKERERERERGREGGRKRKARKGGRNRATDKEQTT
jgi:hypothetical protein